MGIYMVTTWAPFHKANEGASIVSKISKLPPYITKWRMFNAADGKKGGKTYNIVYVDDSRIAEAGLYISKVMSLFYEIEGFCWKIEPLMSQRDAVKVPSVKI